MVSESTIKDLNSTALKLRLDNMAILTKSKADNVMSLRRVKMAVRSI